MSSYARTRKDFEFLETIHELNDQVELDAQREDLMRNPTKARAQMLYHSAIHMWFREHGIEPGTKAIAKRHFYP